MKIGEVYLMRFTGSGSEQNGWRPGLVFQNNTGNRHSPNIIALPLTGVIKKTGLPTHVTVRAADSGLRRDSVVLCENPERMSRKRVGRFIATMPDHYMRQIVTANLLATSAISYLDRDALVAVWERASALNGNAV